MTTVSSLAFSSAVNYAQLHISHRIPLFVSHLQSVVYHSIISNCLCLQWKMRCMLLYYPTSACTCTFVLLCSSHALQEIAFVTLPSLLSP